jgi:hypothetical protein
MKELKWITAAAAVAVVAYLYKKSKEKGSAPAKPDSFRGPGIRGRWGRGRRGPRWGRGVVPVGMPVTSWWYEDTAFKGQLCRAVCGDIAAPDKRAACILGCIDQ